ncbi:MULTISPECIES: bifunctional 4-hydroxy-2-oxoglutarate aldolase/2-dehydro-3-deoxy-phosphogluconate aldolase [Microbacterium]|uniref:bifunctional 4-hydroxy-2-oxoglutarate aldolase/2-dehydro-3-deoxy-phosphogluconate aldolase n=1 Tax=Microbacterium TaxID=33882 RepID=UPI00343471AC
MIDIERTPASTLLRAQPVVAVLRARHARDYAPVVEALLCGEVRVIELTLSTDGVFEELPALLSAFDGEAEIGVGTVTTPEEAGRALDIGARFLVTPTFEPSVIDVALARQVPVLPGGLTPTELHAGWRAGATAVKVFPASVVGPKYVSDLRGPFPDIEIVPSGGLDADDAVRWIEAGALAVSIGGPLLQDAFHGGDLTALTERALRISGLVAEAIEGRAS